ncbi:MAG TPA: holo-ACP synthase [Acidimicrobiales bacterium]
MGGALVGIGIDSVDIERFAAVLTRRASLAKRVFTAGEREYAGRLADPTPALAARFAAKEAAMKALGVGIGSIDWPDVEVVRSGNGGPLLAVTGRAAALAAGRGIGSWLVSLTHTETVASAVVAAVS